MTKKKILFLAPSLAIGGAERVMVNLLKKLDLEKYDVTVCLFANYGSYYNELPKQIHVTYLFSNVFLSRTITWIETKLHVRHLINLVCRLKIKGHYDAGICFSDGLLTNTLVATRSSYDKLIAWVHSCYLAQSDLRAFYSNKQNAQKLLDTRYKYIDEVVCVSTQSHNEFNEIFNCEQKSRVIYNLFDANTIELKAKEFSPKYNQPQEKLRVVSIGRLVGVKKLSRLLEAKKLLQDEGVDFALDLVGDGPETMVLKAFVDEHHLMDVTFWGFQNNPYPYLAKADILALTSESEAFPTVLIEAMLLSKPIVSTKCSGCIEITDNGKSGLLCEHDPKDIAEKLKQMLSSKALREKMALLGHERVKFFSEEKTLKDFDQLINIK
nr:glycosyltransferase [uncultured Macellibacteroides sp.]